MNDELVKIAQTISSWSHDLLLNWGVSYEAASYVNMLFLLTLSIVLVYLSLQIIKRIIRILFNKLGKTTHLPFFSYLNKNKFSVLAGLLIPYLLLKILIPIVFNDFPLLIKLGSVVIDVWLIFLIINITISVIRSGCDILVLRPAFRNKPMTSYIQVLQIILYIVGLVIAFSTVTGKSPAVFFTAMGAASAVLLLMFQDSIKGFIASIQVTSNDMVRLNDWITVPKYGADGDVIEINLTTVKVQNFDKTITTLPTYALISDSFQNWRGMENANGRRIKRALNIKQSSIRFISDEEHVRFKKIQGLSKYIDEKQAEIDEHNRKIGADRSLPLNGRNLTNAGLFRVYVEWYLKTHPQTKKDYTMMVRQLAPAETGIPFEVYVFADTINWVKYEAIMSDIFDHLMATVKYFDLEIFELESGGDIKRVELRVEN